MLFGGEEPRIEPNDLKKLSPQELAQTIETKRALLIKEYKLKQKPEEISKGLVGMRNLGNTCFMNSALQCLSNTSILTDYLLKENWEDTINTVSMSAEGRLVCEYFTLLKKIWCESSYSVNPGDVKKAIVRVSRTFAGYSQQDTQEFLAYFLDALHEDLNQVYIKPYIQQKDYEGEDIKLFADEAWRNHTMRNRSFIIDNFHGQYFSKIRCPDCKHESITCDPFDMISLNLPTRDQIKVEGYFMSYTYDKETFAFGFMTDAGVTLDKILARVVADWNKGLTNDETKLDVNYLLPYFHLRSRIVERVNRPFEQVTAKDVMANDGIFFILEQFSPLYSPLVFKEDCNDIVSQLTNKSVERHLSFQVFVDGKNIAVEKEVTVPQNISSLKLYQLVYLLHRKAFLNVQCRNSENIVLATESLEFETEFRTFFPADLIDPATSIFVVSFNDIPVLTLNSADAIFHSGNDKASITVHLNPTYFAADPKLKSCKRMYVDNIISGNKSTTLYNCLDHFVSEEKLDKDNTWFCPKCKEHKEALKRMAIMRYPKILIVHLKRFKKDLYKQNMVYFKKNNEVIDFPIDGLDLNKYVVNGSGEPIRYTLFGVANHYGNCGGGHYTAICRNKHSRSWHMFDDSDVSTITDNKIITDAAYVLFYELKTQ